MSAAPTILNLAQDVDRLVSIAEMSADKALRAALDAFRDAMEGRK